MQKSGDNTPCPHDNRIRISDLRFTSTSLFVTEITKNALSLRITVLVELRLCLLICSTERKTGLSNTTSKCASMEFVWNMEDLFQSIHQIFHSILEPFHIPYRFFPSIPYHSMPCINQRRVEKSTFEDQSFCKISSTPVVTSCYQVHALNADAHIPISAALLCYLGATGAKTPCC